MMSTHEKDSESPPVINLFSLRHAMTAAFAGNDYIKFSELLDMFNAIGGWDPAYDNLLNLVKELCELSGNRKECMVSLMEHDPNRFNQAMWLRVAGTAPLEYIRAMFSIDPAAAYTKLSILGTNPAVVPRSLDLLTTVRLIRGDPAKVTWFKHIGIQVMWPAIGS